MKLSTAFASVLVLALAATAVAQMPAKPGPEVKKLEYFVGTWTTEGTIQPGPWGNGGKFSATDTSEWMPGNFFVVGHSDYKMPAEFGGDGKGTYFLGYDTDKNVYTSDEFTSEGRHEASKGTFSSDTWVWTSTATYGGQEVQQKMTMKVVSPTSYTMKFESSIDGTNWMTFMECKSTKK
jgi:uncharacterized protein DUF1579